MLNWIWLEKENDSISVKMNKNNKHRGGDFRDFLQEEGILEEVEERALKQLIALHVAGLLKQKRLSKTEMAARMNTSRAAVDRLLDANNPSATLGTLAKAARALGQKVSIKLVPA